MKLQNPSCFGPVFCNFPVNPFFERFENLFQFKVLFKTDLSQTMKHSDHTLINFCAVVLVKRDKA